MTDENPLTVFPGTFDESKFDLTHDDQNMVSDARADIAGILRECGGFYHVIRQTKTVDSMGRATALSDTHYNVNAYISSSGEETIETHSMGEAVKGRITVFFQHEYTQDLNGIAFNPKRGDIFEDHDQKRWEMKVIKNRRIGDKIIFKAVDCLRIDNEGDAP